METANILVKALEEIVEKSDKWLKLDGSDAYQVPWWELEEIASKALKKHLEAQKDLGE
jgi:hypothetical protein